MYGLCIMEGNIMKVSVIVPVYNTEKYVGSCIESILNQTFDDFELILIDDGSTDGSLNILRSYEQIDSRIIVIHQDNAGPGLTRNKGIDLAKGEYIVFVDSDDLIEKDYLKRLSKQDADVVFIDIIQVDENNRILNKEYMSHYTMLSKNDFLRYQMTGSILWGGVRKAVRASILREYDIRYSDNLVGEEAIYSFLVLYYAKSYSFLDGPIYKYLNRSDSQSSLILDDPLGPVSERFKDELIRRGLLEEFTDTMNAFIAVAAVSSVNRMAIKYPYKTFRRLASERIDHCLDQLGDEAVIDIQHMPDKAKIVYNFVKKKALFPIYFLGNLNKLYKSVRKGMRR